MPLKTASPGDAVLDDLRQTLAEIRTACDALDGLLAGAEPLPGMPLARLLVDADSLRERLQRGLADLSAH